MCSIITFKKSMYTEAMADHVLDEMTSNGDGFSVLLIGDNGAILSDLHTMDPYAVLGVLDYCDYDRAFVHCRLATQGVPNVRNTHGFYNSGVYYQHNGILSDPAARRFAVDSMLIGAKLDQLGLHGTLDWLKTQSYANCFFVDTVTNRYFVTRNTVGSLFTDGIGNFSTTEFETICIPVTHNSEHSYALSTLSSFRIAAIDQSVYSDEFDTDPGYSSGSAYLDDRADTYDFNSFRELADIEDKKFKKSGGK